MPRPSTPIVQRDTVFAVALRVIDDDGIDALSVRRLGRELGVSSAALYHHFENKQEIVVGAAELALRRTPLTDVWSDDGAPEELLIQGAHLLLDTLSAHPALMPVLVDRRRTGMGRLVPEGNDTRAVDLCFDLLERFVIGTVYRSSLGDHLDILDREHFDRAVRALVRSCMSELAR
ncbi:TetR/AcrR family transcriptional regulator [Candidatus Poriferisodalis sp.]|uniref:TetR/AcrR family transcriptional regulator n=1 Tax=Candidatus Poriferisodalis sp. TaxID=3101277 RepID=UPI003B02ACC9